MKALIWKELREQRVLGILAFIVFTELMRVTFQNADIDAERLLYGESNPIQRVQPLLAENFRNYLCIFCAAFAGVLGWMQIYQERHRDLWAFMIHRPIPPTTVFWAKVIAGMILYICAAGLPLLALVLWVQVPGHVAAPFEWGMVLPSLTIFLSGIVAYFTAMLIGLRRARWAGSRALPVGVAAMAFLMSMEAPTFSSATIVILILGLIISIAAHEAFQTHGEYAGQRALAKISLATSLTVGTFIICLFAAGIIAQKMRKDVARSYFFHSVGTNGTVYKVIQHRDRNTEIVTLDGKPALGVKESANLLPHQLPDFITSSFILTVYDSNLGPQVRYGFANVNHYFSFWKTQSGVIWYYWEKYGRIVGFDSKGRQMIGSLGPDGFAKDVSGKGGFLRPVDPWNGFTGAMTRTKDNAFIVDVKNQTVQALLPAGGNAKVVDTLLIGKSSDSPKYAVVATDKAITLHEPNGKVLWELPYNFDRQDYDKVYLAILDTPGVFSVSPKPNQNSLKKNEGKMPTLFMQVGVGKGIIKQEAVPTFYAGEREEMTLNDKLLFAVGSPLFLLGLSLLFPLTSPCLPFAFAYGGICMIIGLVLNRRYSTSTTSSVGWTVFLLLMGVPGLWAYACMRDWPTREKCSACGKPRNVEHEHCEHCQAPFPAPERNGVEIFETATVE